MATFGLSAPPVSSRRASTSGSGPRSPGLGLGGAGAAVRGGERNLHAQRRPRPVRAVEEDSATERLYPVLEADQPGAAGEIGAAGAVVADLDAQDGVGGVGFDGDREG